MKKYMIRLCGNNGKSSRGFKYPMTVGAKVASPTWDPRPVCGDGLHGLEDGNGEWLLLRGKYWQVISYQDKDRVILDQDKVKIRKGVIEYVGNKKGLIEFVKKKKLNPVNESAYHWAHIIGNKKAMIDRIANSHSAYLWASMIGDEDIMINRVKRSEEAVLWAKYIGDSEIMVKRVRSLYHAKLWFLYKLPYQDHLLKKFPQLHSYKSII